jgi:type VI secretion system secreted protein VgrG
VATDRTIWVTTPLGPDVLFFEHMTGHEELGRPFEYELTVLSKDPAVKAESLLGQSVTVSVQLSEAEVRHFNGFVTQFSNVGTSNEGTDATHTRYTMTLESFLGLLNRTNDCRIFQGVSALDAIKTIFREHGFSFEESLNESYRKWEYLVQYRESSFNFVSRMMEQEGIYYYFKHEEGNHTLVLADPLSTLDAFPDYEEVPYLPAEERDRADRDHLDAWRESWQVLSGAVSSRDFDFKKPKTDLTVRAQTPALDHPYNELEVYDPPGEHLTAGEGDKVVRTRLQALHAGALRVDAGGNARGIQIGALFQRGGPAMVDPDPRKFLPISMSHTLSTNRFASGGADAEDDYRCSFIAIDGARPFRTPATTMKPVVLGPQTAIVVGKAGEEIWTDEYGRVMVQFHWDRVGEKNEKSSCWVRVAQVWAGPKWGAIHIPRIGQEVIIDFLEGDPDRPIITGRVYNGDNMPPYDLPTNKTQSGIKSRSSKGGSPSNFNEIRFEDKKGSEELFVQAEKDQNTLVKNNQSLSVGADRSKSVGANETVSVGSNRTETVGADEAVTIGANQTHDVGANRTRSVGANESVTIGANETVTIGAAADETVGASKSLTVAVAYQVTVGAAMNQTIGAALAQEIGGAKSVNVGAVSSENVGGNKSVSAGGNISESAGGNVSISAGKDVGVSAKGNLSAAGGKKAVVSAGDQLTLTCGDATIELKKNGDITINGKKIQIKGSGDVIIKGSKIAEN